MSEEMETYVALGMIVGFFVLTVVMGIAAAWVQRDDKKPR